MNSINIGAYKCTADTVHSTVCFNSTEFDADVNIAPSSNDPRNIAAFNILSQTQNAVNLCHKTTRCGGTTSTIMEILNQGETFLAIVPTTDIGKKTIQKAATDFIEKPRDAVYHVPPNRECPDIKSLYKNYPYLEELPFLLLGNCNECLESGTKSPQNLLKYIRCPIMKAANSVASKTSYSVTIQKLAAILLSKYKKMSAPDDGRPKKLNAAERFYFQFNFVNTILIDECHKFLTEKTSTIEAAIFEKGKSFHFDTAQYDFLFSFDKYEALKEMVLNFKKIWNQETLTESIEKAMEEGKSDIKPRGKKYSNVVKNEFIIDDSIEFVSSIFGEIEDLVIELSDKGTIKDKINSIATLYEILSFTFAENIQVTYKLEKIAVDLDKDKYREKITIMNTVIDPLYNMLLEDFVQDMASKRKRIIFTSATPAGWYDYNQCCPPNRVINNILFGENGDPLKTNDIFYIVPDTRKLRGWGNDSLYKKSVREKYAQRIIQIIEMYGPENCLIVAMNKKMASYIEKNLKDMGHPCSVDYYNSKNMIGVESDSRVMIALGRAEKPGDAYDLFTDSEIKSENRRLETVHADTFQAWSRVKDPNGKVPSIVFALGCTYKQCVNVCKWGYGREVEHIKTIPFNKENVTIVHLRENCISVPQIIKPKLKGRNIDFPTTLDSMALYKKPSEEFWSSVCIDIYTDSSIQYFENIYLNTCSDSFPNIFAKLYGTDSLLCDIMDADVSLLESKIPITNEVIRDHIEGRKQIHGYLLHSGIKTNAVCVEFSDKQSLIRFRGFLDLLEPTIKTLLTEEDGSYNVWFFFNETTAKDAINFVKDLLNSEVLDFKNKDYKIYPTQSCKNSKGIGGPVLLPFFDAYQNGKMDDIEVNIFHVCSDKQE